MFYKQILGGLAVLLVIVSYFPYIRDTLFGKTRPHAFSWLIWLVLTTIGFFIQITNGAGAGAWFNGLMIVVCGIITVFGFIKGKKEIVFIDWICLVLAFIAIYFWLIVKEPVLSIIFVISADSLGMIPTIRKSYVHPYSETLETYAINILRIILGIFALDKITFLTVSYHIYMIIACLTIVTILTLRRRYIKLLSI